ncbi:hypothetical protein PGB90_003037 [Kerria lacca]
MKKNEESKKKFVFHDTASKSKDLYKTSMGIPKSTSSSAASVFTIDNILSSKPKTLNANGSFLNQFPGFCQERGSGSMSPIMSAVSSNPFQFRHQSATVNLNQLATVAAATFSPPTTDFLSKFVINIISNIVRFILIK